MSPKEYAEKLIDKMFNAHSDKMSDYSSIEFPTAKVCAQIAVDEIIKSRPQEPRSYTDTMLYWGEVRQEIEKL